MDLSKVKISVNGVPVNVVMRPDPGAFTSRFLDYDVRRPAPASSASESIESAVPASDSEITYVNPKQFNRILIRRVARAKLIITGRIPSDGKRLKYMHESRHQSALRRRREAGGRFTSNCLNSSSSDSSQDSQISVENEGQDSSDHYPLKKSEVDSFDCDSNL